MEQSFAELERQARAALQEQGLPEQAVSCQRRLALRYPGTDTALTVDFERPDEILNRFESKYRQQFGFCYRNRPLLIASLQVEDIAGEPQPDDVFANDTNNRSGQAHGMTRVFSRDAWHDAPVYRREQLKFGQTVTGPAVVLEPISTIVIEPGWQGTLQAGGDLLLTRYIDVDAQTFGTQVDPVLLEIFNKRFMSVAVL